MARSEDGQEAFPNPTILVGLGKMEISQDQDATLRVIGIGSTLAVAAYDPVRRAGGLLHAMLPHHNMMMHAPTKFVDAGIRALKEGLLAIGLVEARLIWRFTGGAQVLGAERADILSTIARQNIASATEAATRLGIDLTACDVGGHKGRTASLCLFDGRFHIYDSEGHHQDFDVPASALGALETAETPQEAPR